MSFKLSLEDLSKIRQIIVNSQNFNQEYKSNDVNFSNNGNLLSPAEIQKILNAEFKHMEYGEVSILYKNGQTELLSIENGQASFRGGKF